MGYMHCCTTHEPWSVCTVVQPMVHGIYMPSELVYNPSPMGNKLPINHGLYNDLPPMSHGLYNGVVQHCMAHVSWVPVTSHGP